jgi:hypothetical protein
MEEKAVTAEHRRLTEKGEGAIPPWRKWGPYVSERAWGTVREDYSPDGNAWEYLTHDMARETAYRWGEDGIAGLCDRYQVLALTFAFWNGVDPILKERLFGLTPAEGNHGEDVKEHYYYLDNTPTHSYMRYLYKYPHAPFPYEELRAENGRRDTSKREYELVDTGVFNEGRYFDIDIEYAKFDPEDIAIRLTISNRGPDAARIDVVPQLLFRNTWSWHEGAPKPTITAQNGALIADDATAPELERITFSYRLGRRYLYGDERGKPLFTDNETGPKAAFHHHIIDGAPCSAMSGTKGGLHFSSIEIEANASHEILLRLSPREIENPLADVASCIEKRRAEADAFYESIHPEGASDDDKRIQRQALAGMLWSKQIYLYDVNQWLKGDAMHPHPAPERATIRNHHWRHLISKRVMSMPDAWEYPWFAAWDLAFHTVTLALVDIEFAKEQIWYLLFDQFQHPNGQVPAYEWEFSELNPPIHAWAVMRLFTMDGKRDTRFLKKCFHKLILNFVWWVNKVDRMGNNVFEGGFLGLDNITVIDRSEEIPGGGKLEQSDGTGWMGMFCLLLMRMALELARDDSVYESLAVKFFEHFVYISTALQQAENRDVQLWNEKDGFFYDVINFPDGHNEQIYVRSLVGIIPLYTVDSLTQEELATFPEFAESFTWFTANRPDITHNCVHLIDGTYLFTLIKPEQIERVMERVWDPGEFRSDYGLRSLSKCYEKEPYELLDKRIQYEPGEAISILKGGNSNWRGPIWFPTTFLLIEALQRLDPILGRSIEIDGASLGEMADYFAKALISLFRKGDDGKRPIYGDYDLLQSDPHFADHILFYEHYHGDTGRGLGASHQTGWSGLVANLIDEWQ